MPTSDFSTFEKEAIQLDEQNPLAHYRHEFYMPDNTIYLDGNSLGLLSKRSEASLLNVLQAWKDYGIDGWTEGEHPWFYLSEKLGEEMAPLVGASPSVVIVTGSTTTNLHQLLATFYQPDETRTKILTDALSFPTDIYAIRSQLQLKGYSPDEHLVKVPSHDGHFLSEADIMNAMTKDIALILLPSVLYRSGQILDMKALTEEAHKRGILIGFDCCHSVGSIPHEFNDWGVDFAFWCTYKHLNAGPGSVAAIYINEKHHGREPGLAGWFGSKKDKQFDMSHDFTPEENAGAFQIGTPHILSVAPLIGSLSLFNEVGIERIREQSLKLTTFMMKLIHEELAGYGFILRTPIDDKKRGAHLFLEHPEAARICKALKDHHIIPDFRAPNGIRLAPIALYNTFEEVRVTVQTLKEIMDNEDYKNYENKRGVIA